MKRIAIPVLLAAVPVLAGPVDQAARPCRIERPGAAKEACLAHIADARIAAMDARIAGATSDLQAATGPELRAFEAALRRAQVRWSEAVEAACRNAAPAAFQHCRLGAALARAEQLEAGLAEARDRLGTAATIDIPVPDSVEVLIPLTVPDGTGGPDAVVRVPLVVPVPRN